MSEAQIYLCWRLANMPVLEHLAIIIIVDIGPCSLDELHHHCYYFYHYVGPPLATVPIIIAKQMMMVVLRMTMKSRTMMTTSRTITMMTMISFRDSLLSELQLALARPAPNPELGAEQ